MDQLTKGANAPLSASRVTLTVDVPAPADLSVLLVTESGKVRSDADFVFYNQPTGPGVRCLQPSAGQPWRVEVDLAAVPADVHAVRLVTSLDDTTATFGRVGQPVARVADDAGTPQVAFTMTDLTTESIVVALELYRRAGAWKVRAVGQGYAGGLADLITDHGVSVDDAPAPAAAPPAPAAAAAPVWPPPPPPAPAPAACPLRRRTAARARRRRRRGAADQGASGEPHQGPEGHAGQGRRRRADDDPHGPGLGPGPQAGHVRQPRGGGRPRRVGDPLRRLRAGGHRLLQPAPHARRLRPAHGRQPDRRGRRRRRVDPDRPHPRAGPRDEP